MDIDAFADLHRGEWERLDVLAGRRRLDGAEADELIRLYQAGATHLSMVRSSAPDPVLISRLSISLARARSRIAGTHEPAWRDIARFLAITLPAALYRIRWWSVGVTVAFLAVSVWFGVWVATTPEGLAAMGPPSFREKYVNEQFLDYYQVHARFFSHVWLNNTWIAVQCVGLGITGVWPALVLVQNAIGVGGVGGMMAAYGKLDVFLGGIGPHGMLELTSVLVAAAAGLKIFWTVIDPGPRPRGRALAEEGRALITVALGMGITLLVSGLIEGFLTGSSLPIWFKIAVGAIVCAAFWAYVFVAGRWAVRAGHSGDLAPDEAGYVRPVAG